MYVYIRQDPLDLLKQTYYSEPQMPLYRCQIYFYIYYIYYNSRIVIIYICAHVGVSFIYGRFIYLHVLH